MPSGLSRPPSPVRTWRWPLGITAEHGRGEIGTPPVAEGAARALDDDLAPLSRRHRLAVLAHDRHASAGRPARPPAADPRPAGMSAVMKSEAIPAASVRPNALTILDPAREMAAATG